MIEIDRELMREKEPTYPFNQLKSLVVGAINLNLKNQVMHKRHIGDPTFDVVDNRMVRLNVGRQAGHSSVIRELSAEDDIILLPSNAQMMYYPKHHIDAKFLTVYSRPNIQLTTTCEILWVDLCGHSYDEFIQHFTKNEIAFRFNPGIVVVLG